MFKADRTYSVKNQKTGMTEWYFQAREGNAGPYHSKKKAEMKLNKFIQTCIKFGYTGGREVTNQEFRPEINNYITM